MVMLRSLTRAAGAVVVAILISGAAVATFRPRDAAAASGGAQQCDVLTRREVQRAIGHRVEPGDPPMGVGGRCSFSVRGAPTDLVSVWVLEGDDAQTGFEVGKKLGGEDAVAVPKLGEDAVYLGDPLNTAYVLDDGTLVYLQYYVLSGDDSAQDIKRAVVSLTGKALDRATS